MTTFVVGSLPKSITTVEELTVWCCTLLAEVNPTLTAIEGSGSAVPVAEFNSFKVRQENKTRIVARASIELENDHLTKDGHVWEHVRELSQEPIPAHFLAA